VIKWVFALFLLLALFQVREAAWGEDNGGRLACIFPLTDLSGGDREREKTVTEAVGMEFQAAGFRVVPREQLQSPVSDGQSQAVISLARGYGADLAVSGFFTTDEDRLLVTISCYDVLGEGLIGGFVRSWRFNLGFYNSLHDEIAGLLSHLEFSEAPPQLKEVASAAGLRTIELTSTLEGMEVLIAGETKAGEIENGRLILHTPGIEPGTLLKVEKKKAGYHSAWETVRAAETVTLAPIFKNTEYAVEINSTLGQLLGAGGAVRMYFIPDFFFVGVSIYPYAQVPIAEGGSPVFHADLGFFVGQYLFFPADFPFRIGVSAGFGGIFSLVLSPNMPPYTDFYINILNVWTELNLQGISFFLRSEMKYSLGIGNNALAQEVINWEHLPPITLGVLLK
jgi:hypothetical protein